MMAWKTLGLRGRARGIFLKTQTSYRAQDRQKKSEQAKVRTLQRAVDFFSSRAWRVLMAPAWVLADERPSFTVDAANPHVVAVLCCVCDCVCVCAMAQDVLTCRKETVSVGGH